MLLVPQNVLFEKEDIVKFNIRVSGNGILFDT